ncbi:MAG: abortive phage infection protein [Lachnospiraceae bacterium]|nr:abortive phage infection protein [Lachnospiraceae bacterium]
MKEIDLLDKIIEDENGYLITAEAVEAGFTKPYILKYAREHKMEKAAHGIYILEDVWPDELFILQKRSRLIVYSGETALYLHGLTDREYSKICFTVPTGYNASHIKVQSKEVHYAREHIYELGICERPSSSGNMVHVYDMERCICDLIKDRKKYDVQLFQTAIKEYMSHMEKNLSRLIEYAQKLGVRDEVMKYVEVLA